MAQTFQPDSSRMSFGPDKLQAGCASGQIIFWPNDLESPNSKLPAIFLLTGFLKNKESNTIAICHFIVLIKSSIFPS
jgi:hypothetical protein